MRSPHRAVIVLHMPCPERALSVGLRQLSKHAIILLYSVRLLIPMFIQVVRTEILVVVQVHVRRSVKGISKWSTQGTGLRFYRAPRLVGFGHPFMTVVKAPAPRFYQPHTQHALTIKQSPLLN